MQFSILASSKKSKARVGRVTTLHGGFATPAFMPIATKAAVKNLTPEELSNLGAEIILSNTYHLWLRPGLSVIKKAGGLHRFMGWKGPILSDSGGFQVFSLSSFRKVSEKGVVFRDPLDGSLHTLTPERSIAIQQALGSDIVMAFDECPPYPTKKADAKLSMDRTTRWAKRCLATKLAKDQALFGIVQGATYPDLRKVHAQELAKLRFDGFALGGLAVGEPMNILYRMIDAAEPHLPKNKPRYVMGLGRPDQLVEAIRRGMDMFDCVLPTRDARHGRLYVFTPGGRAKIGRQGSFWMTMTIKNARYIRDIRPIDQTCSCLTCTTYSRAYLRHLFATNEPLAGRLATVHNLAFYLELMGKIRSVIESKVL